MDDDGITEREARLRRLPSTGHLYDGKTNTEGILTMLTARYTKIITRVAFIAGELCSLGILVVGAAYAETPDDEFLGVLRQQGIAFGAPQSAIGIGHHVCDALGGGMEPSAISEHIAAANSRIDRQTALAITVDAATSYCPEFVHQMPNGATVIGPNH
jgi:hypothetical protein